MEDFVIRIDGEIVTVTREVYEVYYKTRRRERTQEERDARNRLVHYNAWDNADGNGEDAIRSRGETPEQALVSRSESDRLRGCIDALPGRERELICALYFDRKSIAAVSRETGVPERTLGYRRDKALKTLRKMLGER
jgi:RNA polymerase sigma factor (sigma-70 family)